MSAPKDVKYDKIAYDEIPERTPRGSVIEEALSEIEATPTDHGKAFCIAQYAKPTAATAAANVCRQRHGKPEANGWWFGTRKVADGDVERTGLFVKFTPSLATPEGKTQFEKDRTARNKNAAEKRAVKAAEKKAEAAKGGGKAK